MSGYASVHTFTIHLLCSIPLFVNVTHLHTPLANYVATPLST